jgi:hypothetical protein
MSMLCLQCDRLLRSVAEIGCIDHRGRESVCQSKLSTRRDTRVHQACDTEHDRSIRCRPHHSAARCEHRRIRRARRDRRWVPRAGDHAVHSGGRRSHPPTGRAVHVTGRRGGGGDRSRRPRRVRVHPRRSEVPGQPAAQCRDDPSGEPLPASHDQRGVHPDRDTRVRRGGCGHCQAVPDGKRGHPVRQGRARAAGARADHARRRGNTRKRQRMVRGGRGRCRSGQRRHQGVAT